MTLKIPSGNLLPVLDVPSKKSGKKVFLTRRPVSLAGKPLLAEKHIQVQPSGSLSARKCYATTIAGLFKQKIRASGIHQFKPDFRSCLNEVELFENSLDNFFSSPRSRVVPAVLNVIHAPSDVRNIPLPHDSWIIPGRPEEEHLLTTGDRIFATLETNRYDFTIRPATPQMLSSEPENFWQALPGKGLKQAIKQNFANRYGSFSTRMRRKKFICNPPALSGITKYLHANLDFTGASTLRSPLKNFLFPYKTQESLFEPQCDQCRSQRTSLFTSRLKLSPEQNGPEREIHANFVLESKITFSPVCRNILQNPCEDAKAMLTSSGIKHDRQDEFAFAKSRMPVSFPQRLFPPESCLKRKARAVLKLHQTASSLSASFSTPAKQACFQAKTLDNRFKLRLKLKRQAFNDTQPQMKELKKNPAFFPEAGVTGFIPASFKNFQIKNPLLKGFLHYFTPVDQPESLDFKQKRGHFFLRASAHARYTLRCLKNLAGVEFSRLKPLKLKLSTRLRAQCRSTEPVFSVDTSPARTGCAMPFKPCANQLVIFSRKPVFSDILIDDRPRKFITTPRYLANLCYDQTTRRQKPLRMLRFKLQAFPITSFLSSRDRAPRLIRFEREIVAIISNSGKRALPAITERFTRRMREKQLRPGARIRLRRATLKTCLPSQIVSEMQLSLEITGVAPSRFLPQKNFVQPSVWEKKLRHFSCRLRLLPHPFGFPEFRFSENTFVSLHSRGLFKVVDRETHKAFSLSAFILKFEKPFLHPLSMKNPRRLLYNLSLPSQVHEMFCQPFLITTSNLTSAPKIKNFEYPWRNSEQDASTTGFNLLKMTSAPRTQSFKPGYRPEGFRKCKFNEEEDGKAAGLKLPVVKRLLLRARKFAPMLTAGEFPTSEMGRELKFSPATIIPVLLKPTTSEAERFFKIFNAAAASFLHQWSDFTPPSEKIHESYQMRLRTFRFPWRPESPFKVFSKEQFSLLFQTDQTQTIEQPDEVRTTSFFFDWSGSVKQKTCYRGPINCTPQMQSGVYFGHILAKSAPPRFLFKAGMVPNKILQETAGFQQFIDPESFFRFKEKTVTRLKKVYRNYSFRHPFKNDADKDAGAVFSEYGMKNLPAESLTMDTIHWIIMMRSFISLAGAALEFVSNGSAKPENTGFVHNNMVQNRYNLLETLSIDHTGADRLFHEPSGPMPQVFADPAACFADLPFDIAAKTMSAEQPLKWVFTSMFMSNGFLSEVTSKTRLPKLAKPIWQIAIPAKDQPLQSFTDTYQIPKFHKSTNLARTLETAEIKLPRAGYRFINLPDWIDTFHTRPDLN